MLPHLSVQTAVRVQTAVSLIDFACVIFHLP